MVVSVFEIFTGWKTTVKIWTDSKCVCYKLFFCQ